MTRDAYDHDEYDLMSHVKNDPHGLALLERLVQKEVVIKDYSQLEIHPVERFAVT